MRWRAALVGCCLITAACTGAPPTPPASTPSPTTTVATTPPAAPSPTASEPTTTNTLAPPPLPTAAAASTAGRLTAASLPVPAGWRTAVLPGSSEEGFRGNGTWVHARDPRYAAQDVVTIGCADVTRDDYTDPTAALEGNYRRGDDTGVGLVLDFADPAAAERYFTLYLAQVKACAAPDQDPRITVLAEPTSADGGRGLIDRRTYDDAGYTEIGELNGARLTLVILGAEVTPPAATAVLAQITP